MAQRRFYAIENGDTWDLVCTGDAVRVRHQPNLSSGGGVTDYDLDVFLSRERHTPQVMELVHLIGTLTQRGERSLLSGEMEPHSDAGP